MEIILSPANGRVQLRDLYEKGLKDAVEIHIASAYLTNWDKKLEIGRGCKRITFVIGTDFGLSRKSAMRDVLRWLPKHGGAQLLAVANMSGCGFHPKLAAWQTKSGQCYALIGSSNLTKAAFDKNYEANSFGEIDRKSYEEIGAWLAGLSDDAQPVTPDWIENHYTEAKLKKSVRGGGNRRSRQIEFRLPAGAAYVERVKERRKQQAAFSELEPRLTKAIRECASRKMTNLEFWQHFWKLWAEHRSRFQGSGLQISGKRANWRHACQALVAILDNSRKGITNGRLDDVVAGEIDRLQAEDNPVRKAWLSEMLCHYMPDRYPVLNGPVRKWLSENKHNPVSRGTDGRKYIEISRTLRKVLETKPSGARNLAELDNVIWLWAYNKERRARRE